MVDSNKPVGEWRVRPCAARTDGRTTRKHNVPTPARLQDGRRSGGRIKTLETATEIRPGTVAATGVSPLAVAKIHYSQGPL